MILPPLYVQENNMSDKPILRAQACRFRRYVFNKKSTTISDWEPGIAFLKSFGISDVDVIVDVQGDKVSSKELYDYNLLQLRVDGYIAIESYDYGGKVYSPKESNLGDPAYR
jgi:hypothetical protein